MVQLLPRRLPFVLQGIEAVGTFCTHGMVRRGCRCSPRRSPTQIIAQVLDVLNQQALTADYVDLSHDFEVVCGKDRKRKMFVTDPVVTCDLRATLMRQLEVRLVAAVWRVAQLPMTRRACLRRCRATGAPGEQVVKGQVGEATFNQAMAAVEPSLLRQLHSAVNPARPPETR